MGKTFISYNQIALIVGCSQSTKYFWFCRQCYV